jgi:starch phosphorylase
VFTTHTPVPAGNEQFDPVLARKYLQGWSKKLHSTPDEILALGDAGEINNGNFNLTAMALRSSRFANGVSKLHRDVSRSMWKDLLAKEGRSSDTIEAITNGVHTTTWVGLEMQELFSRYLGPRWVDTLLTGEGWERIMEIPDEEIWGAHLDQKDRLRRFLRLSMRHQFARHGQSPDELRELEDLFGTDVLTVGFARRFATYKRAKLVFSDVERLKALVSNVDRPVQIVLAGKAHPADLPGQALIEEIFRLSQSDVLRGLIFFLEDYDMRVGSRMVQGVDVWLNNPRRPMEASGTSGQKSAANGGLNLSVLDGWWPEAYDGDNGWTIGGGESYGNENEADEKDARSLYDLLEQQVVPLYYDRDENGLPREWIRRMKRSIASITPQFSSARMLSEYVRRAYVPAARASVTAESSSKT